MNMTASEAHSQDPNSLEDRLRRYGNTLDNAMGAALGTEMGTAADQTFQPRAVEQVLQASPIQPRNRRRRRGRVVVVGVVTALSALLVSLVSLGGTTQSTIITADTPPAQKHVTAAELKAAYRRVRAQSTMTFPITGPFSFTDTFGAPRMIGTPFASTHDGIDIFAAAGTRVYSMTSGTVRLRSLELKPTTGNSKSVGGFETKPAPWGGLGTFDGTTSAASFHLQFAEVTDPDGNLFVYSNLVPTVADKQVVRAGQTIGTLMAMPTLTPAHLHVARYSPGARLPGSQSFVPATPGREFRANNIYPLLQSLRPTLDHPAILTEVSGIKVSSVIAVRLTSLLAAAKATGLTGISGSGYRSPTNQLALRKAHCGKTDYDIYVKPSSQCQPPTARPGASGHERGVAVDFTRGGRIIGNDEPFAIWLTKNAADYGFFGVADEPWHWTADPTSPDKTQTLVGSTIGTLQIESAQITVPLIEGAGVEQLKQGAGKELSVPPGAAGETRVRCYRSTYGAPCFNLDRVKAGEKISIRTNNVVYEYTVIKVFVINNLLSDGAVPEIEVPASLKGHAILTLTANHPKNTDRQSVVVRAELSGMEFDSPIFIDASALK